MDQHGDKHDRQTAADFWLLFVGTAARAVYGSVPAAICVKNSFSAGIHQALHLSVAVDGTWITGVPSAIDRGALWPCR